MKSRAERPSAEGMGSDKYLRRGSSDRCDKVPRPTSGPGIFDKCPGIFDEGLPVQGKWDLESPNLSVSWERTREEA